MSVKPAPFKHQAYLAKHPILTQNRECIGYELLYRGTTDNQFPQNTTDEKASNDMFLENLSLYGLKAYVGDNLAFVNFSTASLLCELPALLPAKNIIVEIVERTEPTSQVIEHVKKMKDLGFRFALDAFDGEKKWLPLLKEIEFIKLAVLDSVEETIKKYHMLCSCLDNGTKIIVEKVENYQTFELLKQAGVQYFQGYFFATPVMVRHQALNPSKKILVQLISLCAQENLDFKEATQVVMQDIALTTRFLRMVNNISPNSKTKIHSLQQALIYLGEIPFKKMISMFVVSELATDKPSELCRQGVMRAKQCELLVIDFAPDKMFQAYLTGLLSILDAALDTQFDSLIKELNLETEFEDALILKEGLLGHILKAVIANENAQLTDLSRLQQALNINAFWFSCCTEEAMRFSMDVN